MMRPCRITRPRRNSISRAIWRVADHLPATRAAICSSSPYSAYSGSSPQAFSCLVVSIASDQVLAFRRARSVPVIDHSAAAKLGDLAVRQGRIVNAFGSGGIKRCASEQIAMIIVELIRQHSPREARTRPHDAKFSRSAPAFRRALRPRAAKAPVLRGKKTVVVPQPAWDKTGLLRLAARVLKVTLVIDRTALSSIEVPIGKPHVTFSIDVAGRRANGQFNAKSLPKEVATITEHGAEGVAVVAQGKLGAGNRLEEAGIVFQSKTRPPTS